MKSNNIFRKIIAGIMAVIIIAGVSVPANAAIITEKPAEQAAYAYASQPSAWAADTINDAICAGLVPVTLQYNYALPITRADFCKLCVRLYEQKNGTVTNYDTVNFTDTHDTSVRKMAATGIVAGVGNNNFNPGGRLTREQAATILVRLAEKIGMSIPSGTPNYTDNAYISSWAYDAVGGATAAGIMNGTGSGFSPKSYYTREQSIVTIQRVSINSGSAQTIPETPVTSVTPSQPVTSNFVPAIDENNNSENNNDIMILTYHHITTEPRLLNDYTVTDERFRLDMEYLREFGYTTLLPKDLIEIQQGKQKAPENAIMVTFDDGYRSNYEYAYPILKETGMKAVIAVIISFVRDKADSKGPFMCWDEMRELQESGIVEIGSHTYAMHNNQTKGVLRLKGETEKEYTERMGKDIETCKRLIEQNTGIEKLNYFAYPFGAFDKWMEPLLKKYGISVSVLTNPGRVNLKGTLYNLPRYAVNMENQLPVILRQTECHAEPETVTLNVSGTPHYIPAYNIDGKIFLMSGDLAMLFKGTENEFSVSITNNRLEFRTNSEYHPTGAEYASIPSDSKKADSCTEPVLIDGVPHMANSFIVDGNVYLAPESILALLGIDN